MNTMEWLVVLAGVAAVVWVNWYFLFAERGSAPPGAQRTEEEER